MNRESGWWSPGSAELCHQLELSGAVLVFEVSFLWVLLVGGPRTTRESSYLLACAVWKA